MTRDLKINAKTINQIVSGESIDMRQATILTSAQRDEAVSALLERIRTRAHDLAADSGVPMDTREMAKRVVGILEEDATSAKDGTKATPERRFKVVGDVLGEIARSVGAAGGIIADVVKVAQLLGGGGG